MGVYVFRAGAWVKVGHHLAVPRRPNPYYRVAGRGFYSVKHPSELDGKLSLPDLELLAWYPSLGRTDETRVHRSFQATRVGEFHPDVHLDAILAACDAVGAREAVSESGRKRAVAWAARRTRRRVRRKKPLPPGR